MQQNTAKGSSSQQSSTLHFGNGSTIDVNSISVEKNDADVKVDPISGNFVATGGKYTGSITVSFKCVDYREQFENKRQALHDMVEGGDGFTREEIHDLVKTANLLVWQESKESEDI